MAILASQATRRDAKAYFGRFGGQGQYPKRTDDTVDPSSPATVHIALVKLCKGDAISNGSVLPGLAKTLVQLGRLGMPSCVVVEPEENYTIREPTSAWNCSALRQKYSDMVNRVVHAIENQGGQSIPVLEELLEQPVSRKHATGEELGTVKFVVDGIEAAICNTPAIVSPSGHQFLLNSVRRGQIPVIAPVSCGINPSLMPVSADGVIYRICQGLTRNADCAVSSQIAIERVIIIDPIGGLPTSKRQNGFHLYVNLQQEYDEMLAELTSMAKSQTDGSTVRNTNLHLRNLVLTNLCLQILSPTSSALITTPLIASAVPARGVPQSLIHNLLTDKPLVSPSLPPRRSVVPISRTTLLRKGLQVTVYKNIQGAISGQSLDFGRLSSLIEDSFGRHLNIGHYRERIRDKVAAVIVAGDYEGAAVVTKESTSSESMSCWIPYLDKFAVSTNSQGSGGVADIVFNVLTSTFPDDLIWRSRKSNPVNKWVAPSFDTVNETSISNELVVLGIYQEPIGVCFGPHLKLPLQDSQNMSI